MKSYSQIFDAGSRWGISNGKTGVANLVARTLFNKPALTAVLQEKGVNLKVDVDRETFAVQFTAFDKDFKDVVNAVADVINNPSFDQAVIDSEIENVLSQVQKVTDADTITTEMLHETAYNGSSLGHPLVGSPEDIQSITTADLQEFANAHLTAEKCAFGTASSSGSNESTVQIISDAFSSMKKTTPAGDNIKTSTWAYGFETVGLTHPDYWTTKVIEKMIGSWSRLSSVRDNMANNLGRRYFKTHAGYVDSYKAFSFNYCDTGIIGVLGSGPFSQMDPAVFLAAAELQRFTRKASMDPKEVTRAKTQVLWDHTQILRTIQGQAYWGAHSDLTRGKILSMEDITSAVNSISPATVAQVADNLFYDQDHVLAGLIPKQKGYNASTSIDYNQLRSKSHSLRL